MSEVIAYRIEKVSPPTLSAGGTAEAAVKLIRASGGKVVAACFVIDLLDMGGSQRIRDMGVDVVTLCEYPGK